MIYFEGGCQRPPFFTVYSSLPIRPSIFPFAYRLRARVVDKLVHLESPYRPLHPFPSERPGTRETNWIDAAMGDCRARATAVRPGEELDIAKLELFLRGHFPGETG